MSARRTRRAAARSTLRVALNQRIVRTEQPIEWWAGLIATGTASAWFVLLSLLVSLGVTR